MKEGSYSKTRENMAHQPDKIKLDLEEKEILNAYEKGELNPSESGIDFQAAARSTMKKTER